MLFIVDFGEGGRPTTDHFPHVLLIQNNWDDYHYKTTFYVILHVSTDEKLELGSVKILKKNQTSGYTPIPRDPFEELGADYCSLGQDLEYYETLYKLGPKIYRPYLQRLRDVSYSDDIKAVFEDLEGFRVSLLRFSGAERTISDASKLFKRTSPPVKRRKLGFKVKFKTRVAFNSNSFTVEFDFRKRQLLPNRINVLIGYNGTGKTRLLANLAIVASGYGYAKKEDILNQAAGRFIGNKPPFKTVVVVSYSAFDTFVIPGRTEGEKERIKEEGAIFGYVYCGLRERTESCLEVDEQTYRLKTPAEIESEFLNSLDRIREADRLDDLLEILKPLLRDASFQRIGLTQLYSARHNNKGDIAEAFRGLSSGHKAVMKIVTDLTAHIDGTEPTLVLIDEPETHLHPPLLAALLKSIRICLERFDGYGIIATHSPVVLQETPSLFVHVIRRIADQSHIVQAEIETFGESIGVITQEVFNLDDGSTDWHGTLRKLASQSGLAQIEEMFERPLGFAARSEVLSLRAEDDE